MSVHGHLPFLPKPIRTFAAFLFCFITVCGRAQQIIVNPNGDKIVMYPDGSWRAITPGDSLLLRDFYRQEQVVPSATPHAPMTKAEEEEFLYKQALELKRKIVNQEKAVQKEFRDATNNQFSAAQKFKNAEANKKVIEASLLKTLEADYNAKVKILKETKQNQETIRKLVHQSFSLTSNRAGITQNKIEKLASQYNIYLARYYPNQSIPVKPEKMVAAADTPQQKPNMKPEKNGAAKTSVNSAAGPPPAKAQNKQSIPPTAEKAYRRQPFPCQIALDTTDAVTGRRQVAVDQSQLFTYTDPDLRPFLKGKELITCSGWLWKVGNFIVVSLRFEIAGANSKNNFGKLEQGSLIRLKLMDGTEVSLYNQKEDNGRIDPYSGHTLYTGQYPLEKDDIRKLRKNEVDKIRVLWASGYEDYDIFNLDFFMNQLDCLTGK